MLSELSTDTCLGGCAYLHSSLEHAPLWYSRQTCQGQKCIFMLTTYQHYQKGTIKYKNWSINSTFFKSSLTSSLSDLSSLLDGVWARADASGRKATGCWRYVPFDPGTLTGQVEIWKEKKWTSISWRPVASPASFGKLVIANMKFDFNSCHEVKTTKEKNLFTLSITKVVVPKYPENFKYKNKWCNFYYQGPLRIPAMS